MPAKKTGKRKQRGLLGPQPKAGRPPKYEARYAQMAFRHCLLGATNEELAALFDVSLSTVESWLRTSGPFVRAVREGRTDADAHVAKALYHRAIGAKIKATKIYPATESHNHLEITVVEEFPPDTKAAALWLNNRQGKRWRDRQTVDVEEGGTLAQLLAAATRPKTSDV